MWQTLYKTLAFILLSLNSICTGDNRINFKNYGVYKVSPKNLQDVSFLKELDGFSDSLTFLDVPEIPKKDVHIVVAPHKQPDIEKIFNQTKLKFEMIETNLQKYLDIENEEIKLRATREYNWRSYPTLDETYNWIDSLVKKYPDNVKVLVGGKTYEGREIRGVKLSYKSGNKGIFIEGGIHAREWISPATTTYVLNQLLTSQNPDIRNIAENYDWYIFPHINPDGYVYTQTTNRLWRKTRSRNGLFCYGVDPNRNFDYHWVEAGTSRIPCAETYGGRSAFSEIEIKTFSKFLKSLKNIRTYLSFHSYSQLLIFPYGHTRNYPSNYDDLKKIGNAAINALSRRYGTKYVTGTTYEVIYPASGSSVDWVYGKLNIPLAYTYELRPKDTWNGFILPSDQIIPTGKEVCDSLVALVKEAKKLGYYN